MPAPLGGTAVLPPTPLPQPPAHPWVTHTSHPLSFVTPPPPTPGLLNLGNTCFLNAAVQSLFHLPPVFSLLAQPHTDRPQPASCPLCAMQLLAKQLFRGDSTVAPRQFVQVVRALFPAFRGGRQEDAHEFLRALLDALVRAEIAGCSRMREVRLTWQMEKKSSVHGIFGGVLQSVVVCEECGHESRTMEPFLDLSLEIVGVESVEEAMRRFTAVERLGGENKYRCESCKGLVVATKRYGIRRAPNVLALHLKRFDRSRKDGRFIKYEERMDLGEFMQGKPQGDSARYELSAVLVHHGTSRMYGHYYAFVRGKGWEVKDDAMARTCHLSNVLKQKAYILFYTRVQGKNEAKKRAKMVKEAEMMKPIPGPRVENAKLEKKSDEAVRKSPQASPRSNQGSPRTSTASARTSQGSPKIGQASPRTSLGSAGTNQGSPRASARPPRADTPAPDVARRVKSAAQVEGRGESKGEDGLISARSSNAKWEDRPRVTDEEKRGSGERRGKNSPSLRLKKKSQPFARDEDRAVPPSVELGRLALHRRHRSEVQEGATVNNGINRTVSLSHDTGKDGVTGKMSGNGLLRKKKSKLKILNRKGGDETAEDTRVESEDDGSSSASSSVRAILIGGGDAVRKVIKRVFGVQHQKKKKGARSSGGKWGRRRSSESAQTAPERGRNEDSVDDNSVEKEGAGVLAKDRGMEREEIEVLDKGGEMGKEEVEVLDKSGEMVREEAEVLDKGGDVVKEEVEVLDKGAGMVREEIEVLASGGKDAVEGKTCERNEPNEIDTSQPYVEEKVIDGGEGYEKAGTSALFGNEGVDTWDSNAGGEWDADMMRVRKRRRANDEWDVDYDRGKQKKVRQRSGGRNGFEGSDRRKRYGGRW